MPSFQKRSSSSSNSGSNMTTNLRPDVLSPEIRRTIDETFHQALESINRIHAPLQLADRDKANRLAKLSYELAQLHREAHLDEVISPLSPTEVGFGADGQLSSAGTSGSLSTPRASGKQPVAAQHLECAREHIQDQHLEEEQDGKPTWAKIAANAGDPKGKQGLTTAGTADSGNRIAEEAYIGIFKKRISDDGGEDQRRVVEVHKLPKTCTFRQITCQIVEGPLTHISLHDVADNTKTACIFFLSAEDARRFVLKNDAVGAELGEGHSCYGPDVRVLLGNPYRGREDVLFMSGRSAPRRRLTFSGKGLFTKVLPSKFSRDVAAVAGRSCIELIWLFNNGNATVVLTDIRQAVNVLVTFRDKARRPGPYEGIVVSFSTDLCEVNIPLVTQRPGGGEVRVR